MHGQSISNLPYFKICIYICITYEATVYYITDSNSIAVMHQPNNQVKSVKNEKNSVLYSSPVNGDTCVFVQSNIHTFPF